MKNIIALGAENKTTFSILNNTKDELFVSEKIDNLTCLSNFNFFESQIKNVLKNKNIIPDIIACDLHPDYRSTRLAEEFSSNSKNTKLVKVQHHFAHIVSCMFDNDLDEEVIGVSFDGVGFGTDGAAWGGEFLVCSRKDFERVYHLEYVPQPGGDLATREIWRMALSYLYKTYQNEFNSIKTPLLERINKNKVSVVAQMIEKNINSPLTSSMGRLFDAVSSLLGICDDAKFEADGAILLEKNVASGITEYYGFDVRGKKIVLSRVIKGIVNDLNEKVDTKVISAKFHNTLGEIIFNIANKISNDTGLSKVLVSGGCFQNKYLMKYIEKRFKNSDLKLFKHKKYSPTDLGISIGQAVAAEAMDRQ